MAATPRDLHRRWQVHRYERFLNRHAGSLQTRFGASELEQMRREMLQEYRELLPRVPYIGGRRNRWNSNLQAAVWALATYRVVQRHGGEAQDVGRVAYEWMQGAVRRIPRPLRAPLLRPRPGRAAKQARWTQQRRYSADWVCEVVPATGQPFDFGVDVTECAIVKFLHAEGAEELTPYLCHLDYVAAEASGIGLTRTKTLAWGCDRCDFRFTIPGHTVATWPPAFAERTCGRAPADATGDVGRATTTTGAA